MDWGLIFENALRAAFSADAVIFGLAAIGLNMHFGFTGLLNFGQVGFLAIGAYAVAVGVHTWGWSLWAAVFAGIIGALALALALGVPTLRLRADYLAIVTIAAGEIIRLVLRANSFRATTGGSDGLQAFANRFYELNPFDGRRYGIWRVTYDRQSFFVLVVGWTIVGLACLFSWLLIRSPWGRVLKAIREDEDAVRSLGKNVYVYKLQSLAVGGVIGALGGMIFAIDRQSVQPDNYSTALTFTAYTVLILGGVGRILGPVVGAMVYWFIVQGSDVALRQAIRADYITFLSANEVGIVRLMIAGLMLVGLVIFRPQGLIGDKNEVAVSVRR